MASVVVRGERRPGGAVHSRMDSRAQRVRGVSSFPCKWWWLFRWYCWVLGSDWESVGELQGERVERDGPSLSTSAGLAAALGGDVA